MSIKTNTTFLQDLLEQVNALPEAENLDTELDVQNNLITQIQAAVDSLPEAGSEPSTLINFTIQYGGSKNLTTVNAQAEEGMTFGSWIFSEHNNLPINYGPLEIGGYYITGDNITFNIGTTKSLLLDNIEVKVFDIIPANAVYQSITNTACCFNAGTQILVSFNGQTKPIETLQAGDSIISYNIETKENYVAQVKKLIIHENTTDIAEVVFDDGNSVTMNAYHPLYTENGWHSITNHNGYNTLSIGDNVKTINGWSKIININRYTSEPIITYNLDVIDIDENPDVDNNDAYYANGIVAHNGFC